MSTIKLKRSAVGGRIPTTSDLALGELAINTYDGRAYIKKNVSGTESIVVVGRSVNDFSDQGDASTSLTATTADQVVDTIVASTYRSVKYIVQMTEGTDYHTTEVLIVHDGTDTYMTEYGTMFTSASLGTISSDISSGNLRLLVSPVSTNTTVIVHKTMLVV
jgi:hypothetical protein